VTKLRVTISDASGDKYSESFRGQFNESGDVLGR